MMKSSADSVKWHKTDPRDTVCRRATIVILRPNPTGSSRLQAGTAEVETDFDGIIITEFPDHRIVDDWPSGWVWTVSPI